MENLTIKQRIKIACETAGINLGELAAKMGMSQSTLTIRLKNGKFTKEELKQIAEILNCKYISYFRFENGSAISASSTGEEIRRACEYAEMSATDLGRKMGITQPAISSRLKTGKFTHDELQMIASMIGCEYESRFEFKNGMHI